MPDISQFSDQFRGVSRRHSSADHSSRGVWSSRSWRQFVAAQQPDYGDAEGLRVAVEQIRKYPPLVSPGEIMMLRRQLAEVEVGQRYLLQGGDCAERFSDCTPDSIDEKVRLLLRMGVVLTARMGIPVVKVGRIAGQYAKPRSHALETHGGVSRPSFRGDCVHDMATRVADPSRLVQAYHAASSTLNYVRSLVADGLTGLTRCHEWGQGNESAAYSEMIKRIKAARSLIESYADPCVRDPRVGWSVGGSGARESQEIFASHEGLLLEFEEAMTRLDSGTGLAWNLGAHTLWIGERTRSITGAHVEYFRGLANPVGVKIGPGADPEEIAELVRILNPERERGKLMIVTRLGASLVSEELPSLITAVQSAKVPVLWVCDPMHGNTYQSSSGIKTRNVDAILEEYQATRLVHEKARSRLSGVHLEMTAADVTECVGLGVEESDLMLNYQSYCDPRLNGRQSLHVAFNLSTGR